ncbi:MAG: hypothetical protein Q8J76_13160, partial [Desulfobulbaceae bacterium]|nr:hypothetical protein [Desulfobulbaceae bacterium]
MACKGCHINSTGTELEIKKFDLSLATGIRPTSMESGLTHNIPNISATQTPIQIFDYRSCFACHSGMNPAFPTAPIVKPFHGFPGDNAKGAGAPILNTSMINDVGSNSDVANMLPRVALYYHPGIETFRRFGDYFASRTGANNYRRYYSTSDYFGRTTLPSLNTDTGLTSKAMAMKTAGQLFSGEEIIIWRKTATPTYGTAYRTPATGFADRMLAPVSYNLFGAADGPYTSVPYFNISLPQPGPYGEKIAVTKADWNPVTKVLTVWAINDGLEAVQVYVGGTPMTWSTGKGRWEYEVSQLTYIPTLELSSNSQPVPGHKTVTVKNTKDHLVVLKAEWNPSSVGSEFYVEVQNTTSTVLWADYATNYNVPFSNMGGNKWSLIAPAANFPYQVRVHSNNYGDVTALVKDITPSWPPPKKGTITQGTRTSSWDLSRSPDRLRVYVQVGTDGRMPKMRLNGSGTYVDYPCTWSSPNYLCQVSDNALVGAGYDPYVVIYTGASPGEGSVLSYKINNWGVTQSPLLPMTNIPPTAVDDH